MGRRPAPPSPSRKEGVAFVPPSPLPAPRRRTPCSRARVNEKDLRILFARKRADSRLPARRRPAGSLCPLSRVGAAAGGPGRLNTGSMRGVSRPATRFSGPRRIHARRGGGLRLRGANPSRAEEKPFRRGPAFPWDAVRNRIGWAGGRTADAFGVPERRPGRPRRQALPRRDGGSRRTGARPGRSWRPGRERPGRERPGRRPLRAELARAETPSPETAASASGSGSCAPGGGMAMNGRPERTLSAA